MERTTSFTHRLFRRAAGAAVITGGLLAATHGAMPSAQAHPSANLNVMPCLTCIAFGPSISLDRSVDTVIKVSGSGFGSGDPVHVELVGADSYDAGMMLAEADTTSSLSFVAPLGNGQSVTFPGGQFTVSLTPSPASPFVCTGGEPLTGYVRATDGLTGSVAVSGVLTNLNYWWLLNSIVPEPGLCPS